MPHPNAPVIVRQPDGGLIVLEPAIDYDPADPLVKAYPWAFVPLDHSLEPVESMPIETTTAAPGEKRPRPRR